MNEFSKIMKQDDNLPTKLRHAGQQAQPTSDTGHDSNVIPALAPTSLLGHRWAHTRESPKRLIDFAFEMVWTLQRRSVPNEFDRNKRTLRWIKRLLYGLSIKAEDWMCWWISHKRFTVCWTDRNIWVEGARLSWPKSKVSDRDEPPKVQP